MNRQRNNGINPFWVLRLCFETREGFVTGLIDVHGHIVLEGSLGAAGPTCGPELGAYEDGTT